MQHLRQQGMCCMHTLLHCSLSRADAHRQRVDEHPQRTIRTVTALHAAKQHCPEHHFRASTDSRQHLGPGQMAYTRYAHSRRTRLRAQARRQIRR